MRFCSDSCAALPETLGVIVTIQPLHVTVILCLATLLALSAGCGAAPPRPTLPPVEAATKVTAVSDPAALPLDLGTLRRPATVLDVGERRLIGHGSHYASIAADGHYELLDGSATPLRSVGKGRLPKGLTAEELVVVAASDRLTVFASRDEIVLVHTETGAETFRQATPRRPATLWVVDDAVVVAVAESSGAEVFALGPQGKERWRRTFQGAFHVFAACGSAVFGEMRHGTKLDLFELSAATGETTKSRENVTPGIKSLRVERFADHTVVVAEDRVTVLDRELHELWSAPVTGMPIVGEAGVLARSGIGSVTLRDLDTGEERWKFAHELAWMPIGMTSSEETVAIYLRSRLMHVVVLVDRSTGKVREVLDAARPDVVGPDPRRIRSGSRLVDLLSPIEPRREDVNLEADLASWLPQWKSKKSEAHSRLLRFGTQRVNLLASKIVPLATPEGLYQWGTFSPELVERRLLELAGTNMSSRDASAFGALLRPLMLSNDPGESSRVISAVVKTVDELLEQPPGNEVHVAIAHLLSTFVGPSGGAGGAVEVPSDAVANWLSKLRARLPRGEQELRAHSLDLAAWLAVRVANASARRPGLATPMLAELDHLGLPPFAALLAEPESGSQRTAESADKKVKVFSTKAAGICMLLVQREGEVPMFVSELDRCEWKDLLVGYNERALSVTFTEGKQRRMMGWKWSDILEDQDRDGWSDGLEQLVGTDPRSVDSDGDGIADPVDASPSCASKDAPDAAARRAVMLEESYGRIPVSVFMSDAGCVSYSSQSQRVFHVSASRLEGLRALGGTVRTESALVPAEPIAPAATAWFADVRPDGARWMSVSFGKREQNWEVAELFGRWIAVHGPTNIETNN